MDRKRAAASLLCGLLLVLLLTACSSRTLSPEEQALCGRWAYSHDPDTAVLTLKDSGRAVYEGTDCTFSCDGTFLQLEGGKGDPLRLRYIPEDDGTLRLYLPTEYTRADASDGLAGLWKCEEKNWSFQFGEDGSFSEDGVFTGHFTADEAAGTFTLHYTDYFEDTTCYYALDGTRLTVEYPWTMVRMG